MAKTDRYRVKPGSKFKLATHDPADQSERSKAGKGADAERLAKLGARLNELQDVLYAESKHRILLVLQGMEDAIEFYYGVILGISLVIRWIGSLIMRRQDFIDLVYFV